MYSISTDSVTFFKYISYPVLSNPVFPYFRYGKNLQNSFLKIQTCLTQASNPYEGSESARDNFGKFIYQFQPETKTLIRKLGRILNKLYRQNLSSLFYGMHTHTHTHTHTHIYIYIYAHCSIGIMVWMFAYGPRDGVQSQLESFQRPKKWYLIPCLTLGIIWYREMSSILPYTSE